ncbi:MAG: hypothetical protein K8U57_00945 [Planctomycetes bacterium]|nr:hypothetical protein [Planctomycetota bacterium]
MSTVSTAPESKSQAPTGSRELKVYMHSWLLYWWPVWVVGYLMAAWTLLDNQHMVLVPEGAQLVENGVTVPEGTSPLLTAAHVSPSRVPGLVFTVTLLAVLTFGTGWMWGWRALTFLSTVVSALFLVGWLGAWSELGRWVAYLHVYINLGGYLVISSGLLFLWLVQFFIVDRRSYVVFSMSQMRVHYAIGEEEKVYDAGGVSFEKAPYDWFRWLIGFGAGDMRVRVAGQMIDIPNVIHLGRRLDAIETLLRTKDVE